MWGFSKSNQGICYFLANFGYKLVLNSQCYLQQIMTNTFIWLLVLLILYIKFQICEDMF